MPKQFEARPQDDTEGVGPVAGDQYPHVTAGEYVLRCTRAKTYRHPGLPDRPWKCQLEFHDGFGELEIFGFFHLGTGPKPHAGRASRYWAAWCIANGGAQPGRRQTMSDRMFAGKWFRVTVETVDSKRKGKEREPLPDFMHYSVVREILALAQP